MRNFFRRSAKLSLFLLVASVNTSIAQQPCTPERVMATKRPWRTTANPLPRSKPDLASAKLRVDRMAELLKASYEPRGTDPMWDWSWDGSPVSDSPLSYDLRAAFFVYSCSPRHPSVMGSGPETAVWFYVFVNHFSWFFDPIASATWTIYGDSVLLLTKRVGEIQGYPVYEGIHNTRENTGKYYSRTMIITRPGQSPFQPYTKRAFLATRIKYLEKTKRQQLAAIAANARIRPDADQEADKQRVLASFARTTRADKLESVRARFLQNYRTDQQNRDASLAKTASDYDEQIANMEKLTTSMGEAEASEPAWVGGETEFKSFTPEEQGGQMLVQVNPAYFKAALPKYSPQFLVVYWRWDETPPGLEFRKQLEAKFDFKALQAMIDK